MIVAIDGTTGSGKSTISKNLAQKLNFAYIRTGSFYRAIALKILNENIDYSNLEIINNMLTTTNIQNTFENGHVKLLLDGNDVSKQINSVEVSNFVSKIAQIPEIRAYVKNLQRASAKSCKNIVMEGRDIGSVIFPEAEVKIFIDCDIDVRALRRVYQYRKNDQIIRFEDAKNAILQRDYDDINRKVSPLIRLPEAFYLDTANYTIDECVEILYKHTMSKNKK